MKITVNGTPREVAAHKVSDVLSELGFGDAAVATALNGQFLAATLRAETELTDQDRLEVLAPMQGG